MYSSNCFPLSGFSSFHEHSCYFLKCFAACEMVLIDEELGILVSLGIIVGDQSFVSLMYKLFLHMSHVTSHTISKKERSFLHIP